MADFFMGILLCTFSAFNAFGIANTRVDGISVAGFQFVLPPASGFAFSASRSAMREMWKRWKLRSRS